MPLTSVARPLIVERFGRCTVLTLASDSLGAVRSPRAAIVTDFCAVPVSPVLSVAVTRTTPAPGWLGVNDAVAPVAVAGLPGSCHENVTALPSYALPDPVYVAGSPTRSSDGPEIDTVGRERSRIA